MADNNQDKTNVNDSDIELDPITQGVDRVRERQEEEGRLESTQEEDAQDTQTLANIHLGGRTAEGSGDGAEEGQVFPSSATENTEVTGSPVHTNIEQAEVKLSEFLRQDEISPEGEATGKSISSAGTATSELEFEQVPQTGVRTQVGQSIPATGRQSAEASEGNLATTIEAPLNESPVARDDEGALDENETFTLNVLSNDTDQNNDSLFITDASVNDGLGAVSHDGTNITFNPGSAYDHLAVGETTTVTITYAISDGEGGTDEAILTLTVTGSNDGPIVGNVDLGATSEDTSVTFSTADLLANSSDVDGDSLSVSSVTVDAAYGTVTDNGDDTYTFTPAADYNGNDVPLSFTVSDGTISGSGTASIDVTAVNDGPVAADDVAATGEDSSVNIDVLSNDTDVDGDSLSVTSATVSIGQGTVSINGDGILEYDPGTSYNDLAAGETATVEISYDIADGNGGTSSATATITVNGSNDGPVVEGVEFDNSLSGLSLNEEGRTGDVAALSGLDDFPTDALTIQLSFSSNEPPLASETNGVSLASYAVPGSNNEFLLFAQPNGNLGVYINGQKIDMDVDMDVLFDGESHDLAVSWDSGSGQISVYVDGTLSDTATGQAGQPIQAGGTLTLGQEQDNVGGGFASNQEFSGDIQSFKIFSEALNPADGESSLAFDFDFVADEPLNNSVGDHVFTLDGGAYITTLDEGSLQEDSGGISGHVLASDIDGDNLTFALSGAPVEGSVTVEADGSFLFVPGDDFQDLGIGESRDTSFEIEVSDGHGGSDTQTVTVTVTGQNDGPVAEFLTIETSEDNAVSGQLLASDIEGDNLTFTLSEAPGEGAVTVNADGSFQFAPGEDFQDLAVGESRDVTFSYEVSDGQGGTATETVTVTMNGSNDAPVIGDITNVEGSLGTAEITPGMAMSFNEDGRTGDVALVENVQDFPTDALTVELRFASDEPPLASETNGISLISYATSDSNNEFLLFAQPNGNLGVYINGQKYDMDVDMDVLFDGDFHHLAVSWDSENGELSVFVDGDLTDTTTAQAGQPIQAGGTLALGQEQDSVGGGFASNQEFSGKIADVQVFDENRDALMIKADAETGGVTEGDSSLVHAYDFRSSDSDTVTDQGGGNDMSYSGAIVLEDAGLPGLIGETPLEGTEDGGVITGQLTATDAEGDALSFSLTTDTAEGSVTIDADGHFEFDPGSDFQDLAVGETREVRFTYDVDDGQGGTDQAQMTVTVTGSNDGPSDIHIASIEDVVSTKVEGVSSGVTVVGIYAPGSDNNLLDGVESSLTTSSDHSYFEHGSLGHTGYNYMGGHDWFEDNGISISGMNGGKIVFSDGTIGEIDTVSNGAGDSESAYIYYRAYEDADVTVSENAAGPQVIATLSATDVDVDDSFTYTIEDNANFEIVGNEIHVKAGANLDYEDDSAFSLDITVTDGAGASYAETFSFNLKDVNEAPTDIVFRPDMSDQDNMTAGVSSGTEVVGIYAPGSDNNLLDGMESSLTTSSDHSYFEHGSLGHTGYNYVGGHDWFENNDISISGMKGGTVVFADGTTGVIDTVSNGAGDTESAYIYYRVYDADESNNIHVDENASAGTVVAEFNTQDPDQADSHSYVLNDPSGLFELSGDKIVVKAGADINYEEQVSYNVDVISTDANGLSYSETVTIHINDVNDGPVAVADSFSGTEDQVISGNVVVNDMDADGDSLSVVAESITTAQGGTVDLNADGSFSYTPAADFNGTDSFSYSLSDGTTTDTGSVTLEVAATDDVPIVGNVDLGATSEDTSVTFSTADLLANSSDVDGDSLSVSAVTVDASYGTVTDNGDDTYTFTPAADYNGNDVPLNFTVSDGISSDSATATIDVAAVADAPTLEITEELGAGHGQYDISVGGEVTIDVDYLSVNAGYNSSHGYYIADSDGNPIGGAVIQDNVKDFDTKSITINTGDYPGGVTIGFFVIPDGNDQNSGLSDGDAVTFQEIDGVWTPIHDGTPLSGQGAPAYFSDETLNPDGFDHFSDSAEAGNQNWEDLYGGGDQDFTDINTDVTVTLETSTDPVSEGDAGSAIALPDISSALTDTDGSETLTLEISAIPRGAVLSDGSGNSFTATSGNGSVDVSNWNLDDLTVTPAEGSPDFNLQVTATSTEASNGDAASTVQSISIEISDQVIEGTSGAENLQGAGGDDTLIYNADSTWSGYSAHNVETGENVALSGSNRSSDVFDGGDGYDTIQGTSGDDSLFLDDGISGFATDSQARIQNIEEIDMGAGDDIVDMTSTTQTYDEGIVVKGGEGNDTLWTSTGDDTLIGGAGNDSMFGGQGDDTFIFGTNEGSDTVSGGDGWTDVIQLDGFADSDSQQGWTLTLDGGDTILSTDEDINEILLSDDASGTVTFDDGGTIDFDGIEKIVW